MSHLLVAVRHGDDERNPTDVTADRLSGQLAELIAAAECESVAA
jgi:hypothetical protein